MDKYNNEHEYEGKRPGNFFAGLLVGSLAGAATMLLFAPQAGETTRKLIGKRAMQLRDQTTATVEGTVAQVRTKADELKSSVNDKAQELKHQGQDILVDQLDRVSAAAKNGKKAIQGKE
jgi:gas vesicle protein